MPKIIITNAHENNDNNKLAFISQNTNTAIEHIYHILRLKGHFKSKTFSDNTVPSSPKFLIHRRFYKLCRRLKSHLKISNKHTKTSSYFPVFILLMFINCHSNHFKRFRCHFVTHVNTLYEFQILKNKEINNEITRTNGFDVNFL